MRIVHLVPLVSDDGGFGGPVKVALAQASEMQRRGHSVCIAGGWRGATPAPQTIEDVPVRLFPAKILFGSRGFSGVLVPGLGRWIRTEGPTIDVVHVHSGRHLASLIAGRLAQRLGIRTFVQTHGMVPRRRGLLALLLDATLTRPLLRHAVAVYSLTPKEDRQLEDLVPTSHVRRLLNGLPPSPGSDVDPTRRAVPQVLFCSRLHVRKRPTDLVHVGAVLRDRGIAGRVRIVGPDEGEGEAVRAAIAAQDLSKIVTYDGPVALESVSGLLFASQIYVLPSVDEPFPMGLLEALAAGVPSVCTTSCGIADELRSRDAAEVVLPGASNVAAGVVRLLLDEDLWLRRRHNGLEAIREYFGISPIVDQLEADYGIRA